MPPLVYVRLIGFTAGTLLNLFLVVLVVGYRRPRAFERALFFLALTLFLFYAGLLLELNAQIYYVNPPATTLAFAVILVAVGLGFLPPLLVHLHAAYDAAREPAASDGASPRWRNLFIAAFYLPLGYFGPVMTPRLFEGPPLGFLRPGSRVGIAYGLWLAAAMVAAMLFERRFLRLAASAMARRFHRALIVLIAAAAALVVYVYVLGGPRNPAVSQGVQTAVLLVAIVPTSLLGYFVLRFNFLEIGGQRNLVYAVSSTFLALLYLSVVRRMEVWLEPVLPPEATAAILLFVLVVFFEPLQRSVGRALHRTFRLEVDRLQRLIAEIQQEARSGELQHLLKFCEVRIREEFDLASVRIVMNAGGTGEPLRPASGSARTVRIRLGKGREEKGVLEASASGAALSGDTFAALEFLAEQLPAIMELCRLIEEKLELERELAERERLALVGQMAASISHNLKNPLGSMKTVMQVQLENPELPENYRKDCELVIAEIDRLGAKLGQLLRYAKPSVRAGGTPQRVAPLGLAEQVVSLLGREAERRHVKLELEHAGEEALLRETFVRGSEEALSDVLSNLIVNAIEVLPARGRICVRLERRDSTLRLEVTDNGPGIPAEFRDKIFQPFFTTKPSGTGLGLAIVERRLAEMEGSISWESPVENGRGTRFVVTLPLAE